MKRKKIYIKLLVASLMLICLFAAFTPPQKNSVWLIGDSTMAWKKPERAPESGWGEGLKRYASAGTTIHNHAASGRSTLSFINEGRWDAVLDSLQAGDFLIIQFGHNDEKEDPKLHTEAFGTFKENLGRFIAEARGKGAIPLLCSSIVRRQFDEEANLLDTHGDYIIATEQLAAETETAYVDMEALTREKVIELGPEESKSLYTFTSRKQDSTHPNQHGAEVYAGLFVSDLKAQGLELSNYFNEAIKDEK